VHPAVSVWLWPVNSPGVFAILANGWTSSDWVIGSAHVRAVDEDWPRPGAQVHYQVGSWPFTFEGRIQSVACERPNRLVLAPQVGPLGKATVTITLEEAAPGLTRVRMREAFDAGLLRWIHTRLNDVVIHYRNRESLQRLGDLARQRSRPAEVLL
jgi:Activator of Hsp90 ATPase homolog 1-like protein